MIAMAKKGYDGASVAEIAKAAKLTPGLVHYHFKDKLEILAALAGNLSTENTSALRQYLNASAHGPAQSIDAIIDYYLGLGASAKPDVLACWIVLSGEALRHKGIGAVFEAALADVQRVVKEQIDEGLRQRVFACDSEAASAALVATIQGYFVLAGTARALIPKGSAARSVKLMMRGLLGAKR